MSWLPALDPAAPSRILCFPHAGSGVAHWRRLSRDVPALVPVALPGRDGRRAEPAFDRMDALIAAMVPALKPALDRPFTLFGHSMGALVAFEVARDLRRRGWRSPERLLLSSRRAPHLPDPYPPVHQLPDAAFVAELQRRFDAIPKVLRDDPRLLALFLPTLKADYAKLDTYAYVDEPPLDVPITAVWGTDDPRLTRPELEGWARHTADFTLHDRDGGHFWYGDGQALRDLLP